MHTFCWGGYFSSAPLGNISILHENMQFVKQKNAKWKKLWFLIKFWFVGKLGPKWENCHLEFFLVGGGRQPPLPLGVQEYKKPPDLDLYYTYISAEPPLISFVRRPISPQFAT